MNQSKIKVIFLLFLISTIFSACSSAGTGESIKFSETGSVIALDNEPSESAVEAETAVSDTETTPSVAAPTIDIAPSETFETDAKGIQVGFTEDGRAYRGNPDALIVIEEFSDFQCPYCTRFTQQTMPGLDEQHIANGDVLLIFYDLPLTNIHPQAMDAANAARCAGEQGAASYWAMHDVLFSSSTQWSHNNPNETFAQFGEDLGLEMDSFTSCLESLKYQEAIETDMALATTRGVRSTPSFFINDQPLVGAQPLTTFLAAIETINGGGELAAAEPAQPSGPQVAPTPATIPNDTAAATLGDPNAPVTIVEYTDYQCPYCSRHVAETLPTLIRDFVDTGRVYYVLKDFPLEQIHPDARSAAIAAHCADEQNAYWEMHDALFAEQGEWSGLGTGTTAYFGDLADSLGLDGAALTACITSGEYDAVVQANLEEGLSLGITGTPSFFIDGFPLVGARPIEHFELAVTYAEEGTLADAYVQSAPQPTPTPSGPVDVPEGDAFVIGEPDAPVTIVEYTDFQCPYCSRHFAQTFPQIKENFIDTGVVRYVFKDFPLTSIHPQANAAAEAARCAREQDAYLEMHDMLFETQGEWNGRSDATDLFIGYAGNLNLNTDSFGDCLQSEKYAAAIEADVVEGSQLGVRGTPAFFINGYFVSGAQPYELFEEAVAQLATGEQQ